MISAIVLAAGEARRFGAVKALALMDAKPLVRHVVEAFVGSDVAEVILVLSRTNAAFDAALAGVRVPLRSIVNAQATDGMSSSLRAGLDALDPGTRAVLIALADQPTIQPQVVRSLIATWRRDGRPIVAPSYRGERGHPVLFDRAMIPELRAIAGDRGARDVVERDPRRVALVPVDEALPRDVDSPDDLAALNRDTRLARS